MPHKSLQTLEKLVEVLDTQSTMDEVVQAFETFISLYKDLKEHSEADMKEVLSMCREKIAEMETSHDEMTKDGRKIIRNLIEKIDTHLANIKLPVVEKVIEKTEVIREKPIVTNEIKEVAVADTPQQILEKVQSLDEGERWSIKDVNGLEEELKKYKKTGDSFGGGMLGKDLIKDIDISSQLDGVTKTFNIQVVYNIVSVSLSSYPYGALRKGIDFSFTPTSITFLDPIEASTQLSSGQVCILTVVSG